MKSSSNSKLNPELNLPTSPITVVHRSDGSGTTFNLVNYLSKLSPDWRKRLARVPPLTGLLALVAKVMKAWRPS